MATTIGVIVSERISAGLVVDHKLTGPVRSFPEDHDELDGLVELHTDGLVQTICEQVILAANGTKDIVAVGVALPGLVKEGVVEEAPNLPQLKGARIKELLTTQLRSHGLDTAVTIVNDADAIYLVDPLGNAVLAWPRAPDIKALANDLGKLLRASQIG